MQTLNLMATTSNQGQDEDNELNCNDLRKYFECNLGSMSDARLLEVIINQPIVEVVYELDGHKKSLFTRDHILLAACLSVQKIFVSPLETLSGIECANP